MRTQEKPLANESAARNGMGILMGVAASHLQDWSKGYLPRTDRDMYISSY
jgi:hypothetical protein